MGKFLDLASRSMRLCGVAALTLGLLAACGGGSGTGAAAPGAAETGRKQALAVQPSAAAELQIEEVVKASEVRVSRTVFDYTFQVRVRNTGQTAYRDVVLTLTAVGAGAAIRDGTVALGTVAAGARVLSTDTITIRQDRTQPFDAAALVWRIEGTTGSTPQAQLAALEAAGTIPSLERGATLAGVDTNADGVRDDVDAYIAAKYPDALQRAAVLQAARALQATLFVDPRDVVAAKAASRRVTAAARCVFNRFPGPPASLHPSRVMTELEGVTTNTKPRLLAYLAYNKALDGTSSSLPVGDTCE